MRWLVRLLVILFYLFIFGILISAVLERFLCR